MIVPSKIEEMFDAAVHEEFQRQSMLLVMKTCVQSRDDVRSRYPYPLDRYLWGHERWTMFDRDWFTLATSFADRGITVSRKANSTNNFSYTEVRAGRVIITASAAENGSQIVKHAQFRDTYARTNQGILFPECEPKEDAPLYAILVYGTGSIASPLPTFVDFAFPEPRQETYAHRIRLFDRFFANYDEVRQTVKPEVVPDDLSPELNSDMQNGEQLA